MKTAKDDWLDLWLASASAKKAVDRNKIKRQMRAAYSALCGSVEKGCLLLFIAQPQISEQSFQDIQHQIQQALRKAKVCHEC